MGNTRIWFTPRGATRATRIDFGLKLRMRRGPSFVYRQAVVESLGGSQSAVIYHGYSRVQLQHTWTRDASGTGDQLRRKLLELVSHLQAGGSCTVAEDLSYAFAAFADISPSPGDDRIRLAENLFGSLAPAVTDVSDREVLITSDPDVYLVDAHLVDDGTNLRNLSFASETIHADYADARWVLCREWGSYPALRMPAEAREQGDYLVHEGEWLFTLDLPLEDDIGQLEGMAAYAGPMAADGIDLSSVENTIDPTDILGAPGGLGLHPTGTLRWP